MKRYIVSNLQFKKLKFWLTWIYIYLKSKTLKASQGQLNRLQ